VGVAPNGVAKTDSVTATVITNNPTGYHLTLSTNTNDNCLKPTSATDCSSASYKINSVSSTPTSPSVLNPNQWGVTLSTTFTNPDKGDDNVWFAVPNQSSPADIKTTPTATIGEATTLIFGSKADYSIPAGMYQGTTVITALPNSYTSPPAPTIANITPNTGLPAGNTPLLLLAQTLILLTKSLSTLTKRQPRRRRKLHQRQHRQCHPNHLHHAACHRRHL
jgi:hypothetical protein